MWPALEEALNEGRPRDALRLAVELWRSTRGRDLAALVDALAAFVESDPRTAPPHAPDDPVELGGWLAWVSDEAARIFEGDQWWTRDWYSDVETALRRFESVDDPRAAAPVAEFLRRARPHLRADHIDRLEARHAALAGEQGTIENAIVARGLARYRDAPQRLIDLVLDPTRDRDDGTEQVASDALSEMGHPFGEAIALQYDAAAGIISGAGRERLTTLVACHERRWLSPALFRATTARVYRGGLLDELTLSPRAEPEALHDPRLARLRVLRAGEGDWNDAARLLRESPWLGHLEELDVPSLELLGSLTLARLMYPKLRRIWLDRLRPVREVDVWNEWAQPLASWLDLLPSLREVVFRTIPEEGLERLVEALLAERLHERIDTFSLDGTRAGWSYVPRGERDPTMWFRVLDGRGVKSAAIYYRYASFRVAWTEAGLDVTLETSEGGDAFRLLQRLPPSRRLARLVFRDFPGRRPKRLAGLGRLRAFLERAGDAATEMPVRWKNQLAGLPTS